MKSIVLLAVILETALGSLADTSWPEKFSAHFSTNTPIIWTASTNHLPKNIWIFRRLGPRFFPVTVISNAIALASLRGNGIPKPSTFGTPSKNDYVYHERIPDNYPGIIPDIFVISPSNASILYWLPHADMGSTNDIPNDTAILKRVWACASQLGVDSAQVTVKGPSSRFKADEKGDSMTNQIIGRSVYLSRQLDGISFWGNGDDSLNDGLWIEFGSRGVIRGFSLTWPDLERYESQPTISPEQIIALVRPHRIMVLPNPDEGRYFERIKTLANASSFTITKITPYYGEGMYGEEPTNNAPPKFVAPFAELEGVAGYGNSNQTVRLLSPLLSSDATKWLTNKTTAGKGEK